MIIPARECHACQMVLRGLRAADLAEIKASCGLEPIAALRRSLELSERAWVFLGDTGRPVFMFGVAPWPGSTFGCPWMIATVDAAHYRRDLMKHTPQCFAEAGRGYTALTNFVQASHREAIRWLTRAGFSFIDFVPEYGVGKQPFLQFFKAT